MRRAIRRGSWMLRCAKTRPSLTPSLAAKSSRKDHQSNSQANHSCFPLLKSIWNAVDMAAVAGRSGERPKDTGKRRDGQGTFAGSLEEERELATVACWMGDGRNKVGRQPLFNLLEGRLGTHLDRLGAVFVFALLAANAGVRCDRFRLAVAELGATSNATTPRCGGNTTLMSAAASTPICPKTRPPTVR